MFFKFTGFNETLVLCGSFFFKSIQGNTACKNDRVHGEALGAKVGVKKVKQEDIPDRQKGFIAVNDEGRIERPSRKNISEKSRKPQHQPGEPDHGNSPKNGQV